MDARVVVDGPLSVVGTFSAVVNINPKGRASRSNCLMAYQTEIVGLFYARPPGSTWGLSLVVVGTTEANPATEWRSGSGSYAYFTRSGFLHDALPSIGNATPSLFALHHTNHFNYARYPGTTPGGCKPMMRVHHRTEPVRCTYCIQGGSGCQQIPGGTSKR
jgi:hypothetical protein